VEAGEPLFIVHANDQNKLEAARQEVQDAFTFQENRCEPLPLIYDIVKGPD
jgi:thymidine phosphorylase